MLGKEEIAVSVWPQWGGWPRAALLTSLGGDDGGRAPRTQNKPAFYFPVLLQTLSKALEEEWVAGRSEQG
jgi:hypothetical protein